MFAHTHTHTHTHTHLFLYKLKPAFTIVEILISLVIIGVIAALTIPNLINYFQNLALETAFKKSYSTLMSALNNVTQDNGGVPYDCYSIPTYSFITGECGATFWPALKSKLNVSQTFVGPVDGINTPDYIGTELISAQGGSLKTGGCSGGLTSSKTLKTAWVLADGSILLSYSNNFLFPMFILDTNGLKKPNKWGYDLFILELLQKSNTSAISINDSLCGAKEQGGYWIKDLLSK